MTLNLEAFNEGSKKKNQAKYKAALGVGSVVSLFGIGSTLAANISLNGGGNVEFGQGVATTAACDEDGFTITPVTYFDNEDEIFKVDYVQVSGVNLTPEGTGYELSGSGVVDQNNDSEVDQSDAKEQFPGQYYDGSDWKRTCDGVVLDFKAYTDDVNYINRTVINDNFESISGDTADLQNPIGWRQDHDPGDTTYNWEPGFALVIDISDDSNYVNSSSGYNFAVDDDISGDPFNMSFSIVDFSSMDAATSTFEFYVVDDSRKTDAASISKITVQSMSQFPSSYKARYEGLGNPTNVR